MDYVKMLTKSAIRTIILLAVLAFVVNGIIAGVLPTWVAAIPVEMSLPIFIGLLIAVLAEDYLEKTFLKKYIQ